MEIIKLVDGVPCLEPLLITKAENGECKTFVHYNDMNWAMLYFSYGGATGKHCWQVSLEIAADPLGSTWDLL